MNGLATAAARTLRAGTVGGLAVISCCAPATAHAAAPGHVILNDVQCPSPHMCITVGNDVTDGNHTRAFSETWNGATWTRTHPREPARANSSFLWAVSCPSARVCVAVGEYDTDSDPSGRPYAQTFRGGRWKITPVPKPRGSIAGLHAVSCASARACVAVGQMIPDDHNNSYSAIWNGRSWRLVALDRPRGTTYSRLSSVSCTGPRSCTAAGEYELHDSAKSRTWIETWNGGAWTRRTTPNPVSGPNGSALESISCATRRVCVAVGHRNKRSNYGSRTIAVRSHGNRWTLTASRDQPGTDSSDLVDVVCPSRRRCAAVGNSFTTTPTQASGAITEVWNAAHWRIDTTPVPPGALDVKPAAVACSRPDACMTIGNYYDTDPYGRTTPPSIPYALTSDGSAWTLAAAP